MADIDDLFKAMNMFKEGVGQLSLQRAISGANEEVNAIRSSEADEAQKRQQLTSLSQNLVAHMAGMGVPESTMAHVASAFAPKQYANANDMYRHGVLNNDAELIKNAKLAQDFESNKAFELAKLKATRSPVEDAFKLQKFNEMKSEFDTKEFAKFSKSLDDTAEVRTAFGKGAAGIQRGDQLAALVGKASDTVAAGNALPPEMVYEMSTGLASMVKGGTAATIDDIKHFAPNIRGMDQAKATQYLTNELQGANAGEWVKLYAKTIARERQELTVQKEDTILSRAQGQLKLHSRDPEQFKATVATKLGISPDEVIIDPKTKKVTTAAIEKAHADTKLASDSLKQAYKAIRSSDANEQAKAQRTFQALGVDPHTSPGEALSTIKYKIRRGLL